MHQKHPKVLECECPYMTCVWIREHMMLTPPPPTSAVHAVFYKTCDVAGAGYVREMDRHAWEVPGSGCSSQPLGEGNNENQRKP